MPLAKLSSAWPHGHRCHDSPAAGVEGGGAGDLLGGSPYPTGLADNEFLDVTRVVDVETAGTAVPRRGTRR